MESPLSKLKHSPEHLSTFRSSRLNERSRESLDQKLSPTSVKQRRGGVHEESRSPKGRDTSPGRSLNALSNRFNNLSGESTDSRFSPTSVKERNGGINHEPQSPHVKRSPKEREKSPEYLTNPRSNQFNNHSGESTDSRFSPTLVKPRNSGIRGESHSPQIKGSPKEREKSPDPVTNPRSNRLNDRSIESFDQRFPSTSIKQRKNEIYGESQSPKLKGSPKERQNSPEYLPNSRLNQPEQRSDKSLDHRFSPPPVKQRNSGIREESHSPQTKRSPQEREKSSKLSLNGDSSSRVKFNQEEIRSSTNTSRNLERENKLSPKLTPPGGRKFVDREMEKEKTSHRQSNASISSSYSLSKAKQNSETENSSDESKEFVLESPRKFFKRKSTSSVDEKNSVRDSSRQRERRQITNRSIPLIEHNRYNELTMEEKGELKRANIRNLTRIVFEAASSSASISGLVSIIRDVQEHHNRQTVLPSILIDQPLISYKTAFKNLIENPDDHIFCVALHAALVSSQTKKSVEKIVRQLGVDEKQFDLRSIFDSFDAFQNLLKFLRAERIKIRKREYRIDTTNIPYKPKIKDGRKANCCSTKFTIVRHALDLSGFTIGPDTDFTCDLLWADSACLSQIVSSLKVNQKFNHFLGMNQILNRNLFFINYRKLSSLLPEIYNFVPQTWYAEDEFYSWYNFAALPKNKSKKFILKPIETRTNQTIQSFSKNQDILPSPGFVIQEYIRTPCLVKGSKFILQVYALITSCDPLRVYIFNDGIVYLSPDKYFLNEERKKLDYRMHFISQSMSYRYMDDLTIDTFSIETLHFLIAYLHKKKENVDKLWQNIKDVVLKTIMLAEPTLLKNYRQCRPGATIFSDSVCFEIVALNFLIDAELKPWLIDIDYESNLDVHYQTEFNIKMKLLLDVVRLLNMRITDREESVGIQREEVERQLYLKLGKEYFSPEEANLDPELIKLKRQLQVVRQNNERDAFEIEKKQGFIRLFPVKDEKKMDYWIGLLNESFTNLSDEKNDKSWMEKYTHQYDEHILERQIRLLEPKKKFDQEKNSWQKIHVENESFDDVHRSRSATTEKRIRSQLSSSMDRAEKQVASTQTSEYIQRSISTSSLKKKKNKRNLNLSAGVVSEPNKTARMNIPGVEASRISEKKFSVYHEERNEQPRSQPTSPKPREINNDKSQMVRPDSILRAKITDSSSGTKKSNIKQELRLTDDDIDRLHQIIHKEMMEISMIYPNLSDAQANKICDDIVIGWDFHRENVRRFWLAQLDSEKRTEVVEIVWRRVQQTIKEITLFNELADVLPLTRNLLIVKRRFLANNGHCLWEFFEDKHSSWITTFVKSTHQVSSIEIDCFYRFGDLCRDAVFILYHHSSVTNPNSRSLTNASRFMIVKS